MPPPPPANRALAFEAQSFMVPEDLGTLVGRSLAVGAVQATPPEGASLSYALLSHTDVFEINSSTGALILKPNQCLDYSTSPTYNLMVTVNDGTVAKTENITVQVQETPNKNLCGTIEPPEEIDGTASPFFYGGNGTQADPYIVPVSRCCADFTLTYDPNYTTSSPNIYFRVNLLDGNYTATVINTVATTARTTSDPESATWNFTYSDASGFAHVTTTIPLRFSPVLAEGFKIEVAPVQPTRGALDIRIYGAETTKQWLGKKSFGFRRR